MSDEPRPLVTESTSSVVDWLNRNLKMSVLSEVFRIDGWSKESQLLFYMGLKSLIFWVLSFFNLIPYWAVFIDLMFNIFLAGFIFTRSDQRFNLVLILAIFFGLSIIVTPLGQATMSLQPVYSNYGTDTGNGEILYYREVTDDGVFSGYVFVDPTKYLDWSGEYATEIVNGDGDLRLIPVVQGGDLVSYREQVYNDVSGEWIDSGFTYENDIQWWESQGVTKRDILDPDLALREISDGVYEEYNLETGTNTGYYFASPKSWENKRKAETIDQYTEEANTIWEDLTGQVSDIFEGFKDNPIGIDNLEETFKSFQDVINAIFILFIVSYGASLVGDAFTFQFGKMAKRIGYMALGIAIYLSIIGIFALVQIEVRSVFDTFGDVLGSIFSRFGLSQLDARGYVLEFSGRTIVNGIASWLPLIGVILSFVLAIYFRKLNMKSMLFAKKIKQDINVVQPSKFKVSILVLIIIFIVYIVGFMLVTTENEGYDSILGLTFFIGAGLVLLLVGNQTLILNEKLTFGKVISWTIFGYAGLMLYFQFVQPLMFNLGWRDSYNDMLFLGQGASVLESDYLKQFFLVCAPETLIFQVGWCGVWNRVYYQLRKGRFQEKRELELLNTQEILREKWSRKVIMASRKGISQKQKIDLLVEAGLIEEKIRNLEVSIKPETTPHRYFILPTLTSGLVGSWLFSDFHRFRRGVSLEDWWRNNSGLAYMGAGYWLTFVAFFNLWAAIFVHWLNNIMVLVIGGG